MPDNDKTLNANLSEGMTLPSAFLSRVAETPWAIYGPELKRVFLQADEEREPPKLVPTYCNHFGQLSASPSTDKWDWDLAATLDAPEAAKLDISRASGTVAVVPVYGVIDSKRIYYADVFAEELSNLLASLVANREIGAIVLDVDSPGGTVYGIPELAEQIRSYRGTKPVYSIATGDMASAAYWVGSAASKVFAAPSARVGSIGVWTAHVDESKFWEEMGLNVTLISAGKFKVEGNPWEPLSDEAREAIQGEVDTYYGMFTEAVAKNRGRRETTVRNGFGEGRILVAEKALAEGLIDGIATLPQLLGAIVPRRKGSRSASARARLALEEANG